MRRAPYGLRNQVPAERRGWVFLERFITSVKMAMVQPEEERLIAFTTTEALFEELQAGASLLRDASQAGESQLKEAMQTFHSQLRSKLFSPASTDAIAFNVTPGSAAPDHKGDHKGVGFAVSSDGATADAATGLANIAPRKSDAECVAGLMERMVDGLVAHWRESRAKVQQRMLRLAVNRNDAQVCHRRL